MASTITTHPQVLSASTLKDEKVVNAAGEHLGNIQEYMIDLASGRIAYCVLSFGGFMGVGDKLFAVPWQAMTLDPDRQCFVLDVAKDRLEQAPGFDKREWPDSGSAGREFQSRVYGFYNVRAYWE